MKLTIDRNRWLRGEGSTNSALLRRSDNKMCCLGFLALGCGAEEAYIVEERIKELMKQLDVEVEYIN